MLAAILLYLFRSGDELMTREIKKTTNEMLNVQLRYN